MAGRFLNHIKKRKQVYLFIFCVLVALNFIEYDLFKDPTSTVVVNKQGDLLSAQIASDGQWRFPYSDSIPEKFIIAVKYFEDQYFNYHFGINPVSCVRALKQNLKAGEIVSGASTITMQTIRLSRKGKPRSVSEKILEMFLAVFLELTNSKEEIISLYASNAPFGGNVVGLDAAAWRYYKRSPHNLSWGEVATLAVLPNSPSLIYPGKNHEFLMEKRNRLLDKLMLNGEIDKITCELAKTEPLPNKPHPLPRLTPHLLNRLIVDGYKGKISVVSIDRQLQENVNRIVDNAHDNLKHNEIHNISVLVINVKNKNVIAYVGNSDCKLDGSGSQVDMITSRRSAGSTLKPFLYASILDEGLKLPHSLISDIPVQILSFSPKNFFKTYDGAVPASNALVRSLNVPAVLELSDYGQQRFYDKLKRLNINTLDNNAKHYGLSLILGGSEITMWDLGRIYTGMSNALNNYQKNNFMYNVNDYSSPSILFTDKKPKDVFQNDSYFDASSIWQTFEVLSNLNRPVEEGQWEEFESSSKIAWKTGTSFGHRDAWAVGITPEYVTVVWVGNSDGEGRPGLTGTNIAAPIMFDIFDKLPKTTWFVKPYDDMVELEVCDKSGDLATEICETTNFDFVPKNCKRAKQCQYHKFLHLDSDTNYIVNSNCYDINKINTVSWFVLPPMMSYYYKKTNPFYYSKPELHPDCILEKEDAMEMIYPKNGSKLFIPRNLDQSINRIVFRLANNREKSIVYWHLDGVYIGETQSVHNREIYTSPGHHKLTVVDDNGNELVTNFEIIN